MLPRPPAVGSGRRSNSAPWSAWLGAAVFAAAAVAGRPCFAQGPSHAGEDPRAANGEAAPKQHFEEALVHYREGHYRAAVAELEAALTFDPTSKDLLYNLALVHEKLGQLDRAIAALERYAELEHDPKELERARQAITRMRGARAEMAPPVVVARVPMPLPTAPAPSPPPEPRKTNPWLVTCASISAAAAVVGVVFGVRALTLRPARDAITSADRSIDDMRAEQARAEDSAVIADISFALSLVSGAGAAVLWLRDSGGVSPAQSARAPLGVSMAGTF